MTTPRRPKTAPNIAKRRTLVPSHAGAARAATGKDPVLGKWTITGIILVLRKKALHEQVDSIWFLFLLVQSTMHEWPIKTNNLPRWNFLSENIWQFAVLKIISDIHGKNGTWIIHDGTKLRCVLVHFTVWTVIFGVGTVKIPFI